MDLNVCEHDSSWDGFSKDSLKMMRKLNVFFRLCDVINF